MNYPLSYFLTISAVLAFSPNFVLGDNVNLSGNLNVNDTQIVSTSNLLISMLVTLAESIIPILVGAAVGHKSITHWQEKKDEIVTRNNIIRKYTESVKYHISSLDEFVERIFKSYLVFQKDEETVFQSGKSYSDKENGIDTFLKFSSDPKSLPSTRFQEEYNNLGMVIHNISNIRNSLYLDLKKFNKEKFNLEEKLRLIDDLIAKSELVAFRFFGSKNINEFVSFHDTYMAWRTKIRNETEKFESELIRSIAH